MSILPVEHSTWCVLRKLLRDGPVVQGKQLRIDKARKTKDGTFLDDLVRRGLIYVFVAGGDVWSKGYALTAAGYQAAENGAAMFVRDQKGGPGEGRYEYTPELPNPAEFEMAESLVALRDYSAAMFKDCVPEDAVGARVDAVVDSIEGSPAED